MALLAYSPNWLLLRKIVADCRRRHTTFAHCMANLIEAADHVASRVKAADVRPLMRIDDDAAYLLGPCAQFAR